MNNSKNGHRYCVICGSKLQKNGIECGKQRWRCPNCRTAKVLIRSDVALRRKAITTKRYLLYTESLAALARRKYVSVRTLQRRNNAVFANSGLKKPVITGEVYPYIIIDATGLNNCVVAIVRDGKYVRNFNFGVYECSSLWEETLYAIPKPGGVVCDGQKGILKALNNLWGEDLIIQRCHFHVMQNMRTKLTRNPESEAGQDLKWLMSYLKLVHDEDSMHRFVATFYAIYELHTVFLDEKTFITNPTNKAGRKWHYTHRNVRSAYRQIASLIEQDQLFAYVTHPELNLPSTTNKLEGGINARLSELLRAHRGMNIDNQMRVVAEYLNSRS